MHGNMNVKNTEDDNTWCLASQRNLLTSVHENYIKRVGFILTKAYFPYTRVGTSIAATIYLQLIQNRYMFRSFTVLQCSHQHCVQPVASDVEVVGYL